MSDKNYSGIYKNNGATFTLNDQPYSDDFVILKKKEDSSYEATFGNKGFNSDEITMDKPVSIDHEFKQFILSIAEKSIQPVPDNVYIATYQFSGSQNFNEYLNSDGKYTYYVFKNIPEKQIYEVYTYILGVTDDPKTVKNSSEQYKKDEKEYEDAYKMMRSKFIIDHNDQTVDVTLKISSDFLLDDNRVYISGDGKHYKITRNNDNKTKFTKTEQSSKASEEIDIIGYFEFVKDPATNVAGVGDKAKLAVKQGVTAVKQRVTALGQRFTALLPGASKGPKGGKKSTRKTKTIKKRVKKTRRKR